MSIFKSKFFITFTHAIAGALGAAITALLSR